MYQPPGSSTMSVVDGPRPARMSVCVPRVKASSWLSTSPGGAGDGPMSGHSSGPDGGTVASVSGTSLHAPPIIEKNHGRPAVRRTRTSRSLSRTNQPPTSVCTGPCTSNAAASRSTLPGAGSELSRYPEGSLRFADVECGPAFGAGAALSPLDVVDAMATVAPAPTTNPRTMPAATGDLNAR